MRMPRALQENPMKEKINMDNSLEIKKEETKQMLIKYNMELMKLPLEHIKLIEKITEKQISSSGSNLKDWVVSELGEEIFEIFYKGYSEKQWMRPCEQIPASIGKRLPIRYDYNDAYHDTKYCGIPKDGNYTQIFEKLLDGIEVQLETDFKDLDWKKLAKKLVYCGPIDELFNYKHGPLEYRSLSFKTEIKDTDNFQGVSQMNFTSVDVPWTRIVEHKWFSPKPTKKTVITYEYPESWDASKERFYPVGDQKNNDIYKKYKDKISCK